MEILHGQVLWFHCQIAAGRSLSQRAAVPSWRQAAVSEGPGKKCPFCTAGNSEWQFYAERNILRSKQYSVTKTFYWDAHGADLHGLPYFCSHSYANACKSHRHKEADSIAVQICVHTNTCLPLCSRQTAVFLQMLLQKSAKNQAEGIHCNLSKADARLQLRQHSVLSLGKQEMLSTPVGAQRVSGSGCFGTSLCNLPGTLKLPQRAWEPAGCTGIRSEDWCRLKAASLRSRKAAKGKDIHGTVALRNSWRRGRDQNKRWRRKWLLQFLLKNFCIVDTYLQLWSLQTLLRTNSAMFKCWKKKSSQLSTLKNNN